MTNYSNRGHFEFLKWSSVRGYERLKIPSPRMSCVWTPGWYVVFLWNADPVHLWKDLSFLRWTVDTIMANFLWLRYPKKENVRSCQVVCDWPQYSWMSSISSISSISLDTLNMLNILSTLSFLNRRLDPALSQNHIDGARHQPIRNNHQLRGRNSILWDVYILCNFTFLL